MQNTKEITTKSRLFEVIMLAAKICTISDDGELVVAKTANSRIEAAWLCVVEFIQWYEENKDVNYDRD